MLVLSRQIDERIIIELANVVIAVQVVDIRGDKVRLGFQAPSIVEIDREEVRRRKQADGGFLERLDAAHQAGGVDLTGGLSVEDAVDEVRAAPGNADAEADDELREAVQRDRERELAITGRIAELEQTLKLVLFQWDLTNHMTPTDQRVYRHAAAVLGEVGEVGEIERLNAAKGGTA